MKQADVGIDIHFGGSQVRNAGGIPEKSASGIQRQCGSCTAHTLVNCADTVRYVSGLTVNSGVTREQDQNRQADI